MHSNPAKIHRGMQRQLTQWRASGANRQHRLGWKIGFNMAADQQRLGLPSAMVGYLSAQQRLASDSIYTVPAGAQLLAEPEVALLLGHDLPANASTAEADAAIAAYSAALELVDTRRSVNDDMEEILAGNLFHDRVLLAEPRLAPGRYARQQLALSLCVNHEERRTLESQRVADDFSALILTVANTLAAHGERLQRGDWIITGAAAKPVAVQAGDEIVLQMGELGSLRLTLA